MNRRTIARLVAVVALFAAGCGGGDHGEGDSGSDATARDLGADSSAPDLGPDARDEDAGDAGDAGGCTADIDCADGVACTVDTCLPATHTCSWTPDDSACAMDERCYAIVGCSDAPPCTTDTDCAGDGVFCNGPEHCTGGFCRSAGMVICDDASSCTADACDETAGACAYAPYDFANDVAHCGTGADDCVACPVPDVSLQEETSCTAGTCGTRCAAGHVDADGDTANGCECTFVSTTDDPDPAYVDANCDGVDGDRVAGIFVSTSAGADTTTCGLDPATACATIGHGRARGVETSRSDLFVMAGDYSEVVVLDDGERLFGGYDARWVRGARTDAAHRTALRGGLDSASGHYVSVLADDIVSTALVDGVVIVGPTPSATAHGASTYAVHTMRASVRFVGTSVEAADGTDGLDGTNGRDAGSIAPTATMNGTGGGDARTAVGTCDTSAGGGRGAAGTNPSCSGTSGGSGGLGGSMDTSCTCPFGSCTCLSAAECAATNGSAGLNAAGFAAPLGTGGAGGSGGDSCGAPGNGFGGPIHNGSGGLGATRAGGDIDASGWWSASSGSSGRAGSSGGGGGGGGASGGCDRSSVPFENSSGAGGGGGGAGGCAAISGGGGGGAGGASFGVFAGTGSVVELTDCDVQRGRGGRGGNGGTGGRGQSGGQHGAGGVAAGSGSAGANGGDGAHGGHGGGGGGGAGGGSFGVFSAGATVTESCTYSGGASGSGGAAGASAPTAPALERDGNDGTGGVFGASADVGACVTPPTC